MLKLWSLNAGLALSIVLLIIAELSNRSLVLRDVAHSDCFYVLLELLVTCTGKKSTMSLFLFFESPEIHTNHV